MPKIAPAKRSFWPVLDETIAEGRKRILEFVLFFVCFSIGELFVFCWQPDGFICTTFQQVESTPDLKTIRDQDTGEIFQTDFCRWGAVSVCRGAVFPEFFRSNGRTSRRAEGSKRVQQKIGERSDLERVKRGYRRLPGRKGLFLKWARCEGQRQSDEPNRGMDPDAPGSMRIS